MSGLSLLLLGPFHAELDGQPLATFRTNKAKALLIYLAVETGQAAGRRETLMTLLWPGMPQSSAQQNLRQAVYHLRQAIPDRPADCLLSDNQQVFLNPDFPCQIDVATFGHLLQQVEGHLHSDPLSCSDCQEWLEEAAGLYRGDFLADFYLADSSDFENWAQTRREALRRGALGALEKLATIHLRLGDYHQAETHARRQLAIDPLREQAHQQLLEALALNGQRTAALQHFRDYCGVLAEELGLEPTKEMIRLSRLIQEGKLVPRPDKSGPRLPPFLGSQAEELQPADEPFVAREAELGRLQTPLEKMLDGQGQILFVTGEAGMGKTRLLRAFAGKIASSQPALLEVFGDCTIAATSASPYLPFRQVLMSLVGGIEPQWRTGTLTRAQAKRLWQAAPQVLTTLVDKAPDLVGTLLPVDRFRDRVQAVLPEGHPTLKRLEVLLAKRRRRPVEEPRHFFEQAANLLLSLAASRPLLIVLDDLQWIDAASAELLFRLGRKLQASRIMIVGAYRPDEVAAQTSHPLQKVLDEFHLAYGDIDLNLDDTPDLERQRFVNALVDVEPNALDRSFREMLCDHTEGNPLMTIETLRNLQASGAVVQNQEGRWVAGESLAWDRLPSRVEGIVQERIGRLEPSLRRILAAASVEGEIFSAQILATTQDLDERELVHQLSHELDKKHRLVSEVGVVRVNGQRLYQYRFRHTVFQQYLYRSLGQIERELMHLDVGRALETLFANRLEDIYAQLAWHFSVAQEGDKAIHYLVLAGDRARDQYANVDALRYYRQALDWARQQSRARLAAQTLMKLGQVHHTTFDFEAARQAFADGFALWQQTDSGWPGKDESPPAGELRLDWLRPATLDPALSADTFTGSLVEQLFWGLVELTPQMALAPGAAQRWDILRGGREYVFHLRPDLRWHDGRPLTAADFVYAWQRILDPATNSPHASALYVIQGARAFHQGTTDDAATLGLRSLDNLTLVVELAEPSSTFLHVLASSLTFPAPRHAIEKHGPTWASPGKLVGNGPFELAAGESSGEMTLSCNPNYAGKRAGNVQRIRLTLFDRWGDSWSQRLANFDTGTADLLYLHGGSLGEMRQAQARHAGEYISAPHFGLGYILFDTSRPPFDDRRVRRAMALAIDCDMLANVILAGYEYPAAGGFIPPGMPGHSPDIGMPYAPVEAAQLLAEAGYPRGVGCSPIRALHMRPAHETDYLVNQWETLGLKIQLEAADWEMMLARLTSDRPHMMIQNATASFPDPATYLRWQAFLEYAGVYRSPRLEEILARAHNTTDQAQRITLFSEADRLLVEQAAVVPLTYLRHHLLLRPRLKQYPLSPLRWWYWRDVVVSEG